MKSLIKFSIKSEIVSLMLIAISIVSSVYFYLHFPARVITHWNYAGVADGWSSRAFGAFFLPVLLIAMYGLFVFLPSLDPRRERYVEFVKTYNIFRTYLLLMMVVIYFVASLSNLGYKFDVGAWVSISIGILFMILGNFMGKLKTNWFIGIRTPWTMSSETVWNRTHRFGGKVFILSGFLFISTSFVPMSWRLPLFVVNIMMLMLGTIAYSYWAFLQEKKANKK